MKTANQRCLCFCLKPCKAVLEDPAALDETSIVPAFNALTKAKAELIPVSHLDVTLLQMLVSMVENADLSIYLTDGQAAFQVALQQAKAVLENPASQEEIDQNVLRLHTAWLNLHLKADEKLIEELLGLQTQLLSLDETLMSEAVNGEWMMLYGDMKTALNSDELGTDDAKALIERADAFLWIRT